MFDVLAGFYGTVVVEVGREVAVTANLCSRIGEQQEAEKGFKALFLCVGAGVGGEAVAGSDGYDGGAGVARGGDAGRVVFQPCFPRRDRRVPYRVPSPLL